MGFDCGQEAQLARFSGPGVSNHFSRLRGAKESSADHREYWQATDTVREEVGSRWATLNDGSAQSLRALKDVAFSTTFGLGPMTIGSAESAGDGVERLGLYQQTSKEG